MTDFEDLKRQGVGSEDESDELRISDLPPETGSHQLLLRLTQTRERLQIVTRAFSRRAAPDSEAAPPALTRAEKHARTGRTLTALGLYGALLLLLIGNVPTLRTQFVGLFEPALPTPTTIVYDFAQGNVPITVDNPNNPAMAMTATITANAGLAPLPATCPRANMLQFFLAPLDPPGLGGDPIWLVGLSGPMASLVHLQPASPGAASGWYQTLTVFIQRDFTGTIVLHGMSQARKGDLEFSYGGAKPVDALNFAPDLILSLPHPGTVNFNPNGDWEMTDINVLVPRAGCYELQASWSNSNWTRYFAAGNFS